MKTSLKLGGFVAVLAAVLALAFGVGNAVGPVGQAAQDTRHSGDDMNNEAGTNRPVTAATLRATKAVTQGTAVQPPSSLLA